MTATVVKLSFTSPVHFGNGRLSDAECACVRGPPWFSALFMEAMAQRVAGGFACGRTGRGPASKRCLPVGGRRLLSSQARTAHLRFSLRTQESESRCALADKKAFEEAPLPSPRRLPDVLRRQGAGCRGDAARLGRGPWGERAWPPRRDLRREGGGHGGLEDGGDAKPYHVGGFHYREGAGLYFIAKGGYDIAPLLESLRYSGLGGKRSAGYGRFEYELTAKCVRCRARDARLPRAAVLGRPDRRRAFGRPSARRPLPAEAEVCGIRPVGHLFRRASEKARLLCFCGRFHFRAATFAGDVFDASAGGAALHGMSECQGVLDGGAVMGTRRYRIDLTTKGLVHIGNRRLSRERRTHFLQQGKIAVLDAKAFVSRLDEKRLEDYCRFLETDSRSGLDDFLDKHDLRAAWRKRPWPTGWTPP